LQRSVIIVGVDANLHDETNRHPGFKQLPRGQDGDIRC
jgi:hypothetical protein